MISRCKHSAEILVVTLATTRIECTGSHASHNSQPDLDLGHGRFFVVEDGGGQHRVGPGLQRAEHVRRRAATAAS